MEQAVQSNAELEIQLNRIKVANSLETVSQLLQQTEDKTRAKEESLAVLKDATLLVENSRSASDPYCQQ